MSSKYNVAIVGVSSVVGEAVLSLLAERDFPLRALYALDSTDIETGRVEFRDSYVPVRNVADFDFSQVQLAFFCAGEELAAQHVPRAAAAGCIVIDDSAQFRYEEDVPLVVPEVNAEAIGQYRRRGIIFEESNDQGMLVEALTQRELETLRLIARGFSNQEIALFLHVHERTIAKYVSSILKKLQVSNRTQAALYAVRNGLATLATS